MTLATVPPGVRDAPRLTADDARRAFWWRALAVAIDLFILGLLDDVAGYVFGVTTVTSGVPGGPGIFTTMTDIGWVWPVVIWLGYYLAFEALFGATVGKWVCRLRVTDHAGRRASLRQIVVRNIARVVDILPLFYLLGGLIALGSPQRLRLGDRLADTRVVRREALAAPLLTEAQALRRLAAAGGTFLVCLAFCAGFFYFGRPPLVIQSMMNTRDMVFSDGVSSYTLSAPSWGPGVVTYQITYQTEQPVETCHARLTLGWTFPQGWQPRSGMTTCNGHTP